METEFILNHPWGFGLLIWLLLTVSIEVGYQVGNRLNIQAHPELRAELVTIRDGLLLLISLMLGFTLTFVESRYTERRLMLIDEVNAISTTYLRTGVLPQPQRQQAQQLLREYVEDRLNADLTRTYSEKNSTRAKQLQGRLWKGLLEVAIKEPSVTTVAYMNSLNDLIDLYEKRLSSLENRTPYAIWLLNVCLSTIACFARGMTLNQRFGTTLILAPLTIAIVIGLIADLDTPGRGYVQLDQGAMLQLKSDILAPIP